MFINTGVVACEVNSSYPDSTNYYVMILDTKDGIQEYWSIGELNLLPKGVLTSKNYRELEWHSKAKDSIKVGKAIAKNLNLDCKSTSIKCELKGDLEHAGILMSVNGMKYSPSGVESDDEFFCILGNIFLTPLYIRFSNGTEVEVMIDTNNPELRRAVESAKASLRDTWESCFGGKPSYSYKEQGCECGLSEYYYASNEDIENDDRTSCLFW